MKRMWKILLVVAAMASFGLTAEIVDSGNYNYGVASQPSIGGTVNGRPQVDAESQSKIQQIVRAGQACDIVRNPQDILNQVTRQPLILPNQALPQAPGFFTPSVPPVQVNPDPNALLGVGPALPGDFAPVTEPDPSQEAGQAADTEGGNSDLTESPLVKSAKQTCIECHTTGDGPKMPASELFAKVAESPSTFERMLNKAATNGMSPEEADALRSFINQDPQSDQPGQSDQSGG